MNVFVIYSEVRDPRFPNVCGSSLSELYDKSLVKLRCKQSCSAVCSSVSDYSFSRDERLTKLAGSDSNSQLYKLRELSEPR